MTACGRGSPIPPMSNNLTLTGLFGLFLTMGVLGVVTSLISLAVSLSIVIVSSMLPRTPYIELIYLPARGDVY